MGIARENEKERERENSRIYRVHFSRMLYAQDTDEPKLIEFFFYFPIQIRFPFVFWHNYNILLCIYVLSAKKRGVF